MGKAGGDRPGRGRGDAVRASRVVVSERRTLATVFVGLITLLALGTSGYHLIEGWDFVDSLYMTVITMTTVGFGEIHVLSERGRVFTIGFIFLAVGMAAYAATAFAQSILDGTWIRYFRRRRMEQRIAAIRDHYIVCGYGRTGRAVVHSLTERGLAYVVIEVNAGIVNELGSTGVTVIRGSGHDNEALIAAGIERARAVIACASTDAENVFICLTARSLRPDLQIASRCDDHESAGKLRKAGANEVVSTYELAGRTLAQAVGVQADDR